MTPAEPPSPELRALLREFVEARIDVPELFARAGKLLPDGAEPSEEILELLAEADLQLRMPPGREAFIRRLHQFAEDETSYTELDLWCFSLGQIESFADDAPLSDDAEIVLLRAVRDWMGEWEDAGERPAPAELHELAQILIREADPIQCLDRLERAIEHFRHHP